MLTHTLIAAAATLSTCAGLPQGDLNDPHTWGNYFLDKYATERADAMTIEPASTPPLAQPRTVLLITGVTIPAVWFDPIKARLERDGFRTVVYEPPALLTGDLFTNAEQLAGVIDGIRAQTGEAKIDILAECTGGLIARHYIQALGGDQYVSRLVTFISPQHGVPKASLASAFVDWEALRDLTPGSDFLDTVNNAPLPSNVPVTSIYSCTDEYIQPYSTSIIPGAKNIGLCDGTFVGHFQFFYDPSIYNIMHAELTAPLPADPNAPGGADDPNDSSHPSDPTAGSGCSSTHGSSPAAVLVFGAIACAARRRRSRRD
jgi:triacylglycerol esterase/lipase EstA (alpha/beta hydrolase family)